jgi:hypothetical protein
MSEKVLGPLTVDEKTASAWLSEGELQPEIFKLEEGKNYRCKVEGNGQTVPSTDPSGDPIELCTYRLVFSNGFKGDVMGDYKLNAHLPNLFGEEVGIKFKGKIKTTKGRQANDYDIVKMPSSF